MPFREPSLSLRDIVASIGAIERFTEGMDFEAFQADAKTIAAVERKLQVISEAAIRLGDDAERPCPGPPWRDIRGIGNWLRHQYHQLELDVVRKTVKDDLPPLKAVAQRALEQSQSPDAN